MASITTEGVSDENGHIYGLPLYLEGYNFCYNVKLFEQANITKLPETLEELDVVCQQLEDAGIPRSSILWAAGITWGCSAPTLPWPISRM